MNRQVDIPIYRQKSKLFKVQIRRKQKDAIFKKIRNQNKLIEHINEKLTVLANIKFYQEQLHKLKQTLLSINQLLIELSRREQTKLADFLNHQSKNNSNNDLDLNVVQMFYQKQCKPYFQFLTVDFKKYTLELLTRLNKQQNKNHHQQQIKLISSIRFQISFMISLLFKSAITLIAYFPIINVSQICNIHFQCRQQRQNYFQLSFDLLQTNLKVLVKQIKSIYFETEKQLRLFLGIMNSLTRVMQYFTNHTQQKLQEELSIATKEQQKRQDKQIVKHLALILNSFNIQVYLGNIMNEFMNNFDKRQQEQQYFNRKQQQQESKYDILKQQALTIQESIIRFCERYIQLLYLVNLQITSLFLGPTICRFISFSLNMIQTWKVVNLVQKFECQKELQLNNYLNNSLNNYNSDSLDTNSFFNGSLSNMHLNGQMSKMYVGWLLQLSKLCGYPGLDIQKKILLKISKQIMKSITTPSNNINNEINNNIDNNINTNINNKQINQNQLQKYQRFNIKHLTQTAQFYYQILVGQNDGKWFNSLQLLSYLLHFYNTNSFTIKDFINLQEQQQIEPNNLQPNNSQIVNFKHYLEEYRQFGFATLLDFIERVTYIIQTESSHFYNQKKQFKQILYEIFIQILQNQQFVQCSSQNNTFSCNTSSNTSNISINRNEVIKQRTKCIQRMSKGRWRVLLQKIETATNRLQQNFKYNDLQVFGTNERQMNQQHYKSQIFKKQQQNQSFNEQYQQQNDIQIDRVNNNLYAEYSLLENIRQIIQIRRQQLRDDQIQLNQNQNQNQIQI